MVSPSSTICVESGNNASRLTTAGSKPPSGRAELLANWPPACGLLPKEEVPPNLPVWHGRGYKCRRGNDDRSRARLTDRNHRLVLRLDEVAFAAGPIFDCLVRAGVGHLSLQRNLGLHHLCRLRAQGLRMLLEQVQLLKSRVEIDHHEHQHEDSCEDCHAARIDWPTIHGDILLS